MKLHASYLTNLFKYLPRVDQVRMANYASKIKTPPYITSEPSVRFTDLRPFWDTGSKLFLFTDGVDNIVDGAYVFTPGQHSGADPIDVVAGLLTSWSFDIDDVSILVWQLADL
ncbi:hypothetical protein C8Q79DRAFT_950203 [Trametes meyenii]|nr:hypothetical protein C8Q79DRAFT_950203 [Trametes meyenii]